MLWPMAKLVTLLEQNLDRLPPTVVIQATTWWETALVHVKLQECGQGVNLPAGKCFLNPFVYYSNHFMEEETKMQHNKQRKGLFQSPESHPLTARCNGGKQQCVFKPRSKI